MDKDIARRLQQIGLAFNIPGPFFSYEEISNGNVNHTYKVNYVVDDGTGMAVLKPYLMQQVNTYAFKEPFKLMENIDSVTEHIRKNEPDKLTLHFHHTKDRKTYTEDEDGFWRLCNYVDSVTYNTCERIDIVRNAGKAFGNFQVSLSNFDASTLHYTIPDFHNTRKRYETLEADVKRDPANRVKDVQKELDFLFSVKEKACRLTDLLDKGELPLRVTHNDTKINNVLFDPKTDDALVVIDLDTVMPGLMAHDFGDAVRFAANFVEEDCQEPEKAGLDLNIFWAFAEGFLGQTACTMTACETETMGLSPFVLACELATRFLDDYIIGDPYFKIRYPEHNLVRTRCQISLAKDMAGKEGAMDAMIRRIVNDHRTDR